MVKITTIKQRAKIILNSEDAVKTIDTLTKEIPQKVHYFDGNDNQIVNATNETIQIKNHGYITGDIVYYTVSLNAVISGLTSGTTYYVIVVDGSRIKLAITSANALAGTAINITDSVGTYDGSYHKLSSGTFTTKVCTNYKYNVPIPIYFNEKNKICVEKFIYNKKTTTPSSIANIYCKSLSQNNIFNSQGNSKGCYLLSTVLNDENTTYNNSDLINNSMSLPSDNGAWVQNGIDIFIDSKKLDINGVDIKGCIDDDLWVLSLIIYDVEEYETLDNNMDGNVANYINPRNG